MSDYKKILDNNKEWVENALAKDPNFFSELAKGQTPSIIMDWLF
jgi:carbonic anhydrase